VIPFSQKLITSRIILSMDSTSHYNVWTDDFKVRDKTKVDQRRADDEARRAAQVAQAAASGQDYTVNQALRPHYGLTKVYTFIRGMLAGICLWQIISTYMLINEGSRVFLSGYNILAGPFQSLYFLLIAVSTVSVFDMYVLPLLMFY